MDRDALARYVQTHQDAIRRCYEQELKQDPRLQGKVVVLFTIKPTGHAEDVQLEENTLGNEAVGNCVLALARGWVFPFKLDDEVTVAYPFVFSPAP